MRPILTRRVVTPCCSRNGILDHHSRNLSGIDAFIVIREMISKTVRAIVCAGYASPVLKVEQEPIFKIRIAQCKTVIVGLLRPLKELMQLRIGPTVLVDYKPRLIGIPQALISEVFGHAFQNLGRSAIVFVFQAGQTDYRMQIADKSKVLGFCFDTLHCDDIHLAITTLAQGACE